MLVVAGGVLATVALHANRELNKASALVAQHCVEAWNAATNRDARARLNGYMEATVGTPRQQAWLADLDAGCRLVVVTASGMAIVWRQWGPAWTIRRLRPVHDAYYLAGHAILSPNVMVCYTARDSLTGVAGTVRPSTVSCAEPLDRP